jgi:hypothetical protein
LSTEKRKIELNPSLFVVHITQIDPLYILVKYEEVSQKKVITGERGRFYDVLYRRAT